MTTYGRKIKLFFYGLGWFGLILLFQNMTYMDYSKPELPKINEDTRLEQAQELLGQKYQGSVAQKSEGHYNLQYHVFGKIHNALPVKWKPMAAEITAAVIEESEKQELDPIFILAVIQTESQFNPEARGHLGDSGLMQILPDTAKWIAKNNNKSRKMNGHILSKIYAHKVMKNYARLYRDMGSPFRNNPTKVATSDN